MIAFDRVLDGVKQVLLVAEEIKRLSESVNTLGVELRDWTGALPASREFSWVMRRHRQRRESASKAADRPL